MVDPNHKEYEDMKEWLGLEDDEQWDPNDFDIAQVNEILKCFN